MLVLERGNILGIAILPKMQKYFHVICPYLSYCIAAVLAACFILGIPIISELQSCRFVLEGSALESGVTASCNSLIPPLARILLSLPAVILNICGTGSDSTVPCDHSDRLLEWSRGMCGVHCDPTRQAMAKLREFNHIN